jgi:hypothetical protein
MSTVLTSAQERLLTRLASQHAKHDLAERKRWGRPFGGYLVFVAGRSESAATLKVLESAGLITVTRDWQQTRVLSRGSYGRRLGGTEMHGWVELRVRLSAAGLALADVLLAGGGSSRPSHPSRSARSSRSVDSSSPSDPLKARVNALVGRRKS